MPAVKTPIGTVAFESYMSPHPLAFPVIRVAAHGGTFHDDDVIPRMLEASQRILDGGQPMLCLYDFREGRLPPLHLTPKLLGYTTAWADRNARAWDDQVQGIVVVLYNPLVRHFLAGLTRVLQPPQPIAYCADMEEALDFLSTIRGPARSFVKDHYKQASSSGARGGVQ